MDRYKILIIDDEVEILQAISRLLRRPEYDLFAANSAAEAREFFAANDIDLVLSDYMLDKSINGVELLKELTAGKPDVITMLITGYVDINIALEAINSLGVYKFILKPWNNEDLVLTVRRALEQRKLILENRRLQDELKKRESLIDQLEKEHPGITSVARDEEGRVILK